MTDFDSCDYFSDQSLVPDPHPYFDHLRAQSPIFQEPHHGVMAITGYDEACAVYRNSDAFSSCISVGGPFPPLPFTPDGDDIGDLIEQHRHELPMNEHMVTMDPPSHTQARSLLNRLLTPRRLKENEDFMWRLADRQLDTFIADGHCEFLEQYAKPFATLVIADLLGVPSEDHEEFLEVFGVGLPGGRVGALDGEPVSTNPLQYLDDKFSTYVEDRRRKPREDVLTSLATATYADGSTPEVIEVVRTATFLFGAGQDTSTKMLTTALRVLSERAALQQRLSEDRSLIPTFVEESLRFESPVKSAFRLTRTTTTVNEVDIPAGTIVMLCPGALNRDPARFVDPHEFRVDRANVREHVAFGRGVHSCPGGPLARVEGRVSIERILDRLAHIAVDETKHGNTDERTYTYDPTFLLRGLSELHLTFTPRTA
jgi:cytochrome P450